MRPNKILAVFKYKDLRNRILFVLGMMLVFRIAANIPISGVDIQKLKEFFAANQFFGLMNLFTGGALEKLSILMLGMGPYITAIVIMQLLSLIFPRLEEMYKEEGEAGRQKFNQYARILTIPLAALQSFSMLKFLQRQGVLGSSSLPALLSSVLTITAGSIFLMWIGELITEKKIGDGISLLILAGILADVPNSLRQIILTWKSSQILSYLLFFIASFVITILVVIINEARRNVPISYAKRIRGRRMYGGVQSYLPMMINPAGVMPIIFALSILMLPGMVATLITGSSITWLAKIANLLNLFLKNAWLYNFLYFLLVFLFTYFYTSVTFDPNDVAENLQKMGGFVPGLRPGKQTADFLHHILNRVLILGAMFLGFIAISPAAIQFLIQKFTGVEIAAFSFAIGGTSILIIVSVILEVSKQIRSQLEMREYE
ncbi:MAG: preprotein translocase subunit SecY [Parcubacteria group bacterium CG_4_9_14_0_2_um_filter_35_11]|nr:MAG: preprotein translocase subunit SecY [Parcubacteria group bacterium CG_4_9_14_0_2_um_filter_35_11]